MNKKGFLLGFAVCLSVVAYGKADSNTGMEHIKDEGTHWENQDDRSLSLPFSIQVEGDVLLFGSDKEAEGVSILIQDAQGVTLWSEEGVSEERLETDPLAVGGLIDLSNGNGIEPACWFDCPSLQGCDFTD